jgi:hypothetical protein
MMERRGILSEAIVTRTYTRTRFPHATTAHVCGCHLDHAGGVRQPVFRQNSGHSFRQTIFYSAESLACPDAYTIKLVMNDLYGQKEISVKNQIGGETFDRDAMFAKMDELETPEGLTRFPDAKRQRGAAPPQHWRQVKYNEEQLIRLQRRKKPPILTAPKAELIEHQNGKRNKPRQVMIVRLSSNSGAPAIR